ncbi:uncharacterized protein LOC100831110 [Brachypodium distachyon]|uniref:Uncharacterized protein n=1 Tax=Brachypodium distachyon TaxID=15368 RepID=I1GWY1_BRADI|nr:uncharacterized protein LOC100831110 [Brachypodium distachyon]XP_010227464.1 uncharacterized protein LOC100831110 [Brachypodium distachyon]KQK17507.1 hypothetical protein BRADI_1g34890v3 [Brachypodium distachyon]KQK17508.1 hypothetical protein BRADI_1g34890v3 [Brachypodium distachyon]|eukprot:XP_003563547.1 uncharacterized protein LOC100831110 [Brachypodium distachyon]
MGDEARGRAVNPNCPNAVNPFHRCADYCPVAAPAVKPRTPPRGRAAQNGTVHSDGEEAERGGRQRGAVNPDCPNAANPFHRCAEYCPVAAPAVKPPPPPPGRAAQNGTVHSDGEEAERGEVYPDRSNAASAAKPPPLPPGVAAQNGGSAHSDGELQPKTRRRDRAGGSGGLPLYVFLREGSDGEGKKVDPRCPNAPNPFHVCTDHCLAKMVEAGRSSEGGKSPISLFSRRSNRSTSSSEDGSIKSGGSKKTDPKCPNAGNPFHECGEHCTAKMKEVEKQKRTDKKSPRRKGGKDIAVMPNWKVDPRCPNAGNPFHICAQYCFDHLNEAAQKPSSKPDTKGKAVMKAAQTGEINPDCVNASNPYHKCGEYCKRNGNR